MNPKNHRPKSFEALCHYLMCKSLPYYINQTNRQTKKQQKFKKIWLLTFCYERLIYGHWQCDTAAADQTTMKLFQRHHLEKPLRDGVFLSM